MVHNNLRVHSFKPIPFQVAVFFSFRMCTLLINSSGNSRFGRCPKHSTAKSRKFPRFSRDLRLLARFCPMKPVLLQDSRIFRIHIPLNFEILFCKRTVFIILEGLKEYALKYISFRQPFLICNNLITNLN